MSMNDGYRGKHTVALLFGILPENQYENIIRDSSGCVQFAADALQKSIIDGLTHHLSRFTIINLPFIGSWPKRYKSWLSPPSFEKDFTVGKCKYHLRSHRFINIQGYKIFDRYLRAKSVLTDFCISHKEEIILVIYSVHSPFVKAALDVKNRFGYLKIILIVPDLPEYMSSNSKGIYQWFRNYNRKELEKMYNRIDGFVFLTHYMHKRLAKRQQPYTIVEGIFNAGDEKGSHITYPANKKTILYSGTLARQYNVMNLVNAVTSLKRDDFVLEIYGNGDTRSEIEALAKVDSRIVYCGQITREKILNRQREAFLLVNPRTSAGEYTKYSFPSKTMEYLASGTPTLMYRLPGIPKEYYSYFYSPDKEDADSMAAKINEILDTPEDVLKDFGSRARYFILENKNPQAQCKKIIELIKQI